MIYRAAAQWFIRMDEGEGVFTKDKAPKTLRQMALEAIEETSFYPRERQGAPARHDRRPARLVHQPPAQLGRAPALLPAQGFGRAASAHHGDPGPRGRHGREGRHRGLEQGHGRGDPGAEDAPHYTKSTDILEVWFDSGTTHTTVLRASHAGAAHESGPEADLYLEGHDQHRGWFHSSLLTACAMYGRAPYRGLLTHGFTVDSQGRKMSKSLGNGIDPQEVSKKLGAEIIRLWVAASDYSGDIAGDDKILARVVDAYRRIRNTLRFLLANVSDFDPAKDAVPLDQMLEIDRYALTRAAQFQAEVLAHYEVYEFHPVVAKLQVYCSEDLGAFYLDILKDRLYTTAPKSLARRSAQTALWNITHAMLRWMAPFLSFTAEEAWKLFGTSESIFFETYAEIGAPDAALLDKWTRIRAVRELVNKEIEIAARSRQGRLVAAGQRGADVPLATHGDLSSSLASLGDDLKFVFITSAVEPGRGRRDGREGDAVARRRSASAAGTGATTSATTRLIPTICGRCTSNLFGAGEARKFA